MQNFSKPTVIYMSILEEEQFLTTYKNSNQIIDDVTTPDSVLLAQKTAIVWLYMNGSIENVVGNQPTSGYVWEEVQKHNLALDLII